MTDISKYKSLAVDHTCYGNRAQVIRMLVEEKVKKLNGKLKTKSA